MTTRDLLIQGAISLMALGSIYLLVTAGWAVSERWIRKLEVRLDRVLNHQLLLNVHPRVAIVLSAAAITFFGVLLWAFLESFVGFIFGAAIGVTIPYLVFNHLEAKRREKLEEQIVDGVTTMSSGVRAGLTLVQSMQLLVQNHIGPIKQEFVQLLREYELGIDLAAAMRNAAERIGSSYYRLLFTAIQAHRDRGGDMGQSLDRIGESIREIQRLEGRLDAITAQGRAQARFMAIMPFVILVLLSFLFPTETQQLFVQPSGRFILLIALGMILLGFVWIRRIMDVDI